MGLKEEVFALFVRPDARVAAEPFELPPTCVGDMGWVLVHRAGSVQTTIRCRNSVEGSIEYLSALSL